MSPKPQFRRVAALDRSFVDRETVLAAFATELQRCDSATGPRVVNLVGVGGIGKSRLLIELRRTSAEQGFRVAFLDLQVPAMRQQEEALAVLRVELGRQGVRFDRFDIAYAVLWQRLHPHLQLSEPTLPFAEESEILTTIMGEAAGVPVLGTAVGLLKLARRTTSKVRERRTLKLDETLGRLDELSNSDLLDAVTYFFAEDVRDAGDPPCAVFVDSYEALVPMALEASTGSGSWLRDLAAQLDTGITVVAGREPLGWQEFDPAWTEHVSEQELHGLPMAARMELLADSAIVDVAELQTIAQASQGLPFYLHLAVDTQPGGVANDAISAGEILQRFLRHVPPAEVRILHLVSVARTFDYEIFWALTESFHLPHDRLVWDSLTAYSFIYPAGETGVRLHQLMAQALRARLSPEARTAAHRRLYELWDERSRSVGIGNGGVVARAMREASYHGVRAGALSAEEVLDYADRALRCGGKQAVDGIRADLETYLARHDDPALSEVERCLAAEAAVLMGNVERAASIADPARLPEPETVPGARLGIAAAHALRIGGDTSEAARLYERVWQRNTGDARITAGLWMADLRMAQGQFATALQLTADTFYSCAAEALELRGDLARLSHLAHRFLLDFDAAVEELERARRYYAEAGSVVGLAHISTNRVELLAWTDPVEALRVAPEAIEAHQDLTALHELGKVYTALGISHLRLDDASAAAESFATACGYLDRAGYRSGRARAELFHAFLHAQSGATDDVRRSADWAVRELVAAEVYPTLVLLAAHLMWHLGLQTPEMEQHAEQARRQIQPVGSMDALEARLAALASDLLGGPMRERSWLELYEAAQARPEAVAGFYNRNVRVDSGVGAVNVRIPIDGADAMDLRLWPEGRTLAALSPYVTHVPRLLHDSFAPAFAVYEFAEGPVCDDVAPRGAAVPEHLPEDVVRLLTQLARVPRETLPPLPPGWPEDTDTAGFARRLSDLTATIYARFQGDHGELYAALGVPADPLADVVHSWTRLRPRPLGCVHADLHRKNMILNDGACVFLDWELALWGDPVYELAVHFHKMGYFPAERDEVVRRWLAAMPASAVDGWEEDMAIYLAHERIKSVLVDTVRYAKLLASAADSAEQRPDLIAKLTSKLNAAYPCWGITERIEEHTVDALLRDWSNGSNLRGLR